MNHLYKIILFSQNPALKNLIKEKLKDSWYEFMRHDEVASRYREYRDKEFSDYQFFVVDSSENVVAICKSIPSYWDGTEKSLPEGYDMALEYAISNYKAKGKSNWNALLGTSVHVFEEYRNMGLSSFCLNVMKDICRKKNFQNLIIPVRPVLKHKFPLIEIEDYVKWRNSDGRVFDPWLRTHLNIGGRIIGIAKKSMVIKSSIDNWSKWTKMQFPSTGSYIVEGALSPIEINCEENVGVYHDPNIWVVHTI